jgi:hypothetical protein
MFLEFFHCKGTHITYREVPVERLIGTRSLLKIHVAYNTSYRIFICHSRVHLKQPQNHLRNKAGDVTFDALGYIPLIGPPYLWKKPVIHNISLKNKLFII